MQRLDYTTREKISTGRGPMDLDAGRLVVREGMRLAVVNLMGLMGAGIAAMICYLAVNGAVNTTGILRGICILIAAVAFLATALVSVFLVGLTALCVSDWRGYQRRLTAWHHAELAAYRAAGGAQVDRQLAVRALSVAEPGHVLWVALALAEKIKNGQAQEPSTAALTGDIWVGRVKVGELSRTQAEEFGRALAQVGVIKGRRAGRAGELATMDPAQLVELVTTRAGRIKSEREATEEP